MMAECVDADISLLQCVYDEIDTYNLGAAETLQVSKSHHQVIQRFTEFVNHR